MEVTSALLGAGVRAFNRLGERLERAGIELVSLDERRLLDAACRETGIPGFGDEGFREPLRLLLRSLRDEGRLTLLGRIAARADIAGLLATRLRLEADRKRYPAIADEVIRHPLFVVGLPRTGSTLLHHLLAQDPGGRVARAWEVMEPSPPPDRARYVLLMLFLALLALAPAALPALLLVAAIGAHTYWVGHLALRLRHQSGRYALFDDTL